MVDQKAAALSPAHLSPRCLVANARQMAPTRHARRLLGKAPIKKSQTPNGGVAKAVRSLKDRVVNRGEVAGRGVDDLQHLEPPANWWTPLLSSEEEREGVEWARDVV